jgi:hypothetical protein
MTTLRELLPAFDAEVDRLETVIESEANELIEGVSGEVESLAMHVNVSVTTLVDAARDKLGEGGVGELQEELQEGVTSLSGVSVTVLERQYLIADIATAKRVLEQIEQSLDAFGD